MIGVFDSGLGGLSVLAALARGLPRADLVYLADTAHVPYGPKSEFFVRARVLAIGEHLIERGCRMLVVACNTATATAIQALRDAHPAVPVVGVEPGVKPAAAATRSRRIAVLATETTARSERLARLIANYAADIDVQVVACPGWATKVETLHLDDAGFADEVRARIEPLLDDGVDQIVLGCTHYAFLSHLIEPLAQGRAALVDVADAVARQATRLAAAAALGRGGLDLLATREPGRLGSALPLLGLDELARRAPGGALLALV
jgi:glutamate racemase